MGGTTADHKEWFSRAFVMAVAASAGYSVQPQQDDVDGVDVVLRHNGITVDVQLKATAVPGCSGEVLSRTAHHVEREEDDPQGVLRQRTLGATDSAPLYLASFRRRTDRPHSRSERGLVAAHPA
jgi:hypothetical protein